MKPILLAAALLAIAAPAAADGNGCRNCYQDNLFTTFFSTLGILPECR